jgi:hypothetical protein
MDPRIGQLAAEVRAEIRAPPAEWNDRHDL